MVLALHVLLCVCNPMCCLPVPILCRIVVLSEGQIVEFDAPNQLLAMKGVFHNMAKDAGLA